MIHFHVVSIWDSRTLQWATAVAVFFLPKHWTELEELMIAVVVMPEGIERSAVLRVLIELRFCELLSE